MSAPLTATLLLSGPDRPGLVAAVSDFIFRNGGNIIFADQHGERDSGAFFMRLVWELEGFRLGRDEIGAEAATLARGLGLAAEIAFSDVRPRAAVFASRTPHCLYDLLLNEQLGELGGEMVVVISNHESLRDVAAHFGVRYELVPVDPDDRAAAERRHQELLDELVVELVVLARYMQVFSPAFAERWRGRMINIHHSFLPAFVGAQAYRQARDRGVKMIGATAHYVTAEVDQGPIIEQDVVRVSHRDEVADLVRKGRELERQVLTRAVRSHLERRVLISGSRTIVFE
ncbi:MAG: formyltetrahydrofolate deformylase [Candidatus Limnocylindria bacterium]